MGSRNKATLIVEALLDGEAEAIVRKVIERAKKGDLIALRLCLDRIAPPRRDRPVRFTVPELGSAGDERPNGVAQKNDDCDCHVVAQKRHSQHGAMPGDLLKVMKCVFRIGEAIRYVNGSLLKRRPPCN